MNENLQLPIVPGPGTGEVSRKIEEPPEKRNLQKNRETSRKIEEPRRWIEELRVRGVRAQGMG